MLFVVASMQPELSGLQQELEALDPARGVGFPVECHLVGIGPRRSGEAMTQALAKAKRRPDGVLMLGIAGAVEPGMETGEVVLANEYTLDADENPAPAIVPDHGMLKVAEAAAAELRMVPGRSNSLTVDHLIAESWERQQLRERYGVGSVNMEDHAVAKGAWEAGVPFLSVRVILDTAEQTLPGYLPGLSKGRNAVFTEILMRPWRIPTMMKLKSQMDLCQSVLTRFGMCYLKHEYERRRSARERAASEAIY